MIIKAISGHQIIIDESDFLLISKHRWSVGSNGYPKRQFRINGKNSCQYLHRYLLSPQNGYHVDHKNGNKLDARRSNLRLCNRHQNLQNQKLSKVNTSGFKGVYLDKRKGLKNRWCAEIKAFGKKCFIGRFSTAELAAVEYNKKAKELHGEFARTNEV